MVAAAAEAVVVAVGVVAAAVAALPGELAAFAEADNLPTTLTNEVPGRARHSSTRPIHVFIALRHSNASARL